MKVLFSSRVHAIVKWIDTSAAEALPGVMAVLTARMFLKMNTVWVPKINQYCADQERQNNTLTECAVWLIRLRWWWLRVKKLPPRQLT